MSRADPAPAAASAVRPQGLWWTALAAGGVLGAVTAAVVAWGMTDGERSVFDVLAAAPAAVEPVVWLPMQLGALAVVPLVALASWLLTRAWPAVVGALASGLVAWAVARLLKVAVGRGRPAAEIIGYTARGSAPVDGLGYPSGHAAVAAALATVVWPWLPAPARWVAAGLAVVVALARVVIGAHLPADVVGGAALGVLVGCCWHLAVGVPARR